MDQVTTTIAKYSVIDAPVRKAFHSHDSTGTLLGGS
jgi:hypothetical protein